MLSLDGYAVGHGIVLWGHAGLHAVGDGVILCILPQCLRPPVTHAAVMIPLRYLTGYDMLFDKPFDKLA
jgi:hypothetical protein